MASVAAPFSELFRLAAAGLAEGAAVLTEAQGADVEAARPMIAYANQVFAGAFAKIEAAARRYMATNEHNNPNLPRPILSDAGLRATVEECAREMESAAPMLSVAGRRVPVALRRWLSDPTQAGLLAMQCDAAGRLAKTKSGRAA